jgi:hypothetical protein
MAKRDAKKKGPRRRISWTVRGTSHVLAPTTEGRGLGRLDEDRANSMTDEGGPPQPERAPDKRRR